MANSIKGAERKLKIILMLQSKKELSATKLADYFGVSKRTIFRDLKALSEMNVPITHDPDFGYSLVSGYKIPPLMFTEKELATVMMGLSFMRSQPQQSMKKDADDVLLKISNTLPRELNSFSQTLHKNIVVSPYSKNLPEDDNDNSWFTICKTIADKQRLNITYHSKSSKTERDVDPYYLVFYKDHWNLLGYCHLRKAPRVFILKNIIDLDVLPQSFEIDPSISLETILYSSESEQTSYIIDVAQNRVHNFLYDLPGELVSIRNSNTGSIIEFAFDRSENDYILKWLTSYLKDIVILEPFSLKNDLKEFVISSLDTI